NDIPPEYMHCLNIVDGILKFDPMDMFRENRSFCKYLKEITVTIQQESRAVVQQGLECKSNMTIKTRTTKNIRGSYCSQSSIKIQELLGLVIKQRVSVRKAGLIVGIVLKTAQNYVKTYKDDE
ncbi:hypothetical protein BDF14DRAFT_1725495, partial [Spinellus fusiger]